MSSKIKARDLSTQGVMFGLRLRRKNSRKLKKEKTREFGGLSFPVKAWLRESESNQPILDYEPSQ